MDSAFRLMVQTQYLQFKLSPELQVLLRWNIQHGSCVIPKSGNADRIKENIGVWGWTLDKDDFDAISNIKFQARFYGLLYPSFLL